MSIINIDSRNLFFFLFVFGICKIWTFFDVCGLAFWDKIVECYCIRETTKVVIPNSKYSFLKLQIIFWVISSINGKWSFFSWSHHVSVLLLIKFHNVKFKVIILDYHLFILQPIINLLLCLASYALTFFKEESDPRKNFSLNRSVKIMNHLHFVVWII